MKKASRKNRAVAPQPSRRQVSPATWLLAVLLVLAPLATGRLEVGSEPVEPSLRGIVVGMFTSGAVLSVAVWLTGVLVLVALVWEWLRKPTGEDAIPGSARTFAGLLLVWFLVSVVASVYRWGSLVAWSYWAVAIVTAWLLSRRRGEEAIVIVHALAVAGTLAALFAVREYAENVRTVPNWRVFGTFFNPGFLAGYLCLTMPVTLSVALAVSPAYVRRSSVRWLAGFGAWLQGSAILLTGTRFAVISVVLALLAMAVWMAFNRSWNRQRAAVFLLFGMITVLTAALLAKPLTQRVTAQAVEAQGHSGGFRIWTWRGTVTMAQAHPLLGTGLGTYEIAYPRYAVVGFTRLAHNSYLQIAAEAGTPALILLLGTLGVLAWTVVRRERLAPGALGEWDGRALRAGLVGAVTAGLSRNLVDSDWSIFACLLTFWAVVAVMLAFSLSDQSTKRAERLYIGHGVLVAAALMVLTMRMAGALSVNSANWNLSQGVFDAEGFERALRWEPGNGDTLLSLGLLYAGMARAGDTAQAQDAESYLQRSAQVMPLSKTWYHLGNLYRDVLGDDAKAIQAYRRALELDPHALRVMVELGKALERKDEPHEAEAVYRRMLEIEKSVYNQVRAVPELPEVDYAFAYAGLARIARTQGKLDEVQPLCARALEVLDAERDARENNPMVQAMPRTPERERALEELRRECERALNTQR